ncbi:MAG: ATP-binding protein [Defluviicoccus sp.]|uniref:Putative ATPase (AAA+ superfamily) n=1 Tax=metagenome TaxID=256318 RepID=A0A380TH01_9ZZZZ|nr:ATP-binding protein [Defluviicoccus sp.]MDG4591120.1 ATP-binding protein [Defluviicoccus sp.]MDG4603101.1 ATP-binding protein [Defluviicoccus sp.]MDG4609972.1 ATP-binding protein [Defluviicoccus sp.]SUS06969.1 putative ATPase (AAA+ superfamily) [uncultured Defluviicoccus sp.]
MDPRTNPYAPGAGFPPPELAGRDDIVERAGIALDRVKVGRAARSFIFYGLRGVGKTVLLNKIRLEAEARGFATVEIEAPEDRSLPGLLAAPLRATLLRLSRGEAARAALASALRALRSFVDSFKVKYQDVEVGLDFEPDKGIADSGDLEADLADLFAAVGRAAAERHTAVVLSLDELQYVPKEHLAALIFAFHRLSQRQSPVTMIAAGLPQLVGQMGRAKSYAERLFEFAAIDRLDPPAARAALCKPAEREGVAYAEDAVAEILRQTQGYPYFLQEWGKHGWNLADRSPVTRSDADRATASALAELDAGFFRVRFDRLTPTEKRYMRAMAELGPGPHRSGDIAEKLSRKVTSVAPIRNSLIAKGMVFSASHGDIQFTVPLFDGFLKRTIPVF